MDSDNEFSVDETSNECSDDGNSNTDSWAENWIDIPDFELDDSYSGIKSNIN